MVDYKIYEFNMIIPGEYKNNHRVELNAMRVESTSDLKILGHLSLDVFDDYSAISWLYVDPDYRNFGIGESLLNRAWEITKQNNLKTIGLIVDKSQEQNRLKNYYEMRGFKFFNYTDTGGIAMWREEI